MADVTRCTTISPFGSEFDSFLFAPIGAERNGTLLSVLSALARLDIDPWQEAARLALLPRDAAIQRLASLIAALPDGPSAHQDPGTVAGGLLALLPRQAHTDISLRETLLSASAVTISRVFIFLIAMAFVMGAQYMMTTRQLPAPVNDAHISNRPTPPLNSGQ